MPFLSPAVEALAMFRSLPAAHVTLKKFFLRELVSRRIPCVPPSRRMHQGKSFGRAGSASCHDSFCVHQLRNLAFLPPSVEAALCCCSDAPSSSGTSFSTSADFAAKATLALLIAAAATTAASSRVACDEGPARNNNASDSERSSSTNDVTSIPKNTGGGIIAQGSRDGDEDDRIAPDHPVTDLPAPAGADGVANDNRLFHGQCLQRQLHRPTVPYPAWDYNWDGRMTPATTLESLRTVRGLVESRSRGTVRHLLLVRHGQYDEAPTDDKDRGLTPLGRVQAHRTGMRLMRLAQGNLTSLGLVGDSRCRFTKLHVSDMQRAKETANIIASYLVLAAPSVHLMDPDPMLNEALPSPMIPVRPDIPNAEEEIDANHDRIEAAFAKYVHRASGPLPSDEKEAVPLGNRTSDDANVDDSGRDAEVEDTEGGLRHEFEVIVGHGNVIRYFVCRGLQIPPEAWLRLSVFNCSVTYLVISPSGYVSVRALGDTGHLSYEETTFSGSHGYNW